MTGRADDWRSPGACVHVDPDLFFPITFFPITATGPALEQIAEAKRICAGCGVREECLAFAREHDPIYGIWGGTTPQDR